jgi:ABC-type tungstate transport system permease subunit
MIRIFALLLSALIATTAQADERFIVLSSTTSTQDSGLFDHILPIFHAATGLGVHVVAVGTGQALAIGARGDADALLVHDRIGEDKFVADGFGIDRRDVMYNDFVIVGPNTDPAPRSPAAATTAAPIGWSFGYGSRPASSPTRIRRGIATSAKAWGRRSTSPPR